MARRRRRTLKERQMERLENRLDRAVAVGALSASEVQEVREEAKVGSWLFIFQLFMMIAEIITKWLDEREDDE